MDINALLAGLLTALRHLDETTRERDEARAQHAGLLKELGEIRAELEALKKPKPRPRKSTKR